MNNKTIFRAISLIGMALGAVATLLSNWADDRELDMVIDEKINEKLTDRDNKEKSEEP